MTTRPTCTRRAVLLRVVVADSGMSVNDSLTALLSEFEGISVLGCVQEAAKVLDLVQATQPGVVILDLQLNAGSGLRLLRQIKRLRPTPVVVVLSDYGQIPIREAALKAGAEYCFNKATECGPLLRLLTDLSHRLPECQLE